MIQEEFLHSDHLYLGGRVVSAEEFRLEFPEWYENWSRTSGNKTLSEYCLLPDYSYGVSASLNAVYAVDIEKATAEYICSFEEERNEGGLFFPPIRIGNVLSFTPMKAHRWANYNLDTGTWTYEDIPAKVISGEGISIRLRAAIGKWVLHIAESSKTIVAMDGTTGKLSYSNCLNEICRKDGSTPIISTMIAFGDSALLFSATGNEVYEFNTNSMQIEKTHKIPFKCKGVQKAIAIRGTDWICMVDSEDASRIIKWNIKTGKAEEIKNLPIKPRSDSSSDLILGFCNDFNGVYIVPQQDNCIVNLDYQRNKASRIELQPEQELLGRKNVFYNRCENGLVISILAYNGNKNLFTVFLPYDFSIAEIDLGKGLLLNRRKWEVKGVERLIKSQTRHLNDGVYLENEVFGLIDFMDDLRGK